MSQATKKNSKKMDARTMSRLAAVQALYQMEHSKTGVEAVIREFQQFRLGGEIEGHAIREADSDFFEILLRGLIETQDKVDPFINRHLSEGWTLKRLDATARAILRCGTYELIMHPEVPYRVVLDEYVELAGSFFESNTTEAGFINALLDSAAKEVRADEIS